jgi:hypothetical protein
VLEYRLERQTKKSASEGENCDPEYRRKRWGHGRPSRRSGRGLNVSCNNSPIAGAHSRRLLPKSKPGPTSIAHHGLNVPAFLNALLLGGSEGARFLRRKGPRNRHGSVALDPRRSLLWEADAPRITNHALDVPTLLDSLKLSFRRGALRLSART